MFSQAFARLVFILALSVSALVSSPARAQQTARQGSSGQIEGFPFPASISGHTRGATQHYPGSGGSGFSVRYAAKSGSASIYIYDRGKDLSSATSSDLAEEMASELRAFQVASEAAGFKPSIIDTSVKANIASAQTAVTSGNRISFFFFITVANGKFVKIQYSTSAQKDASKMATRFRDDYFSRLKSLR